MAINDSASWARTTSKAILLIRVLVGWVFLSEGIQKFLFPDSLGVGRFVKIGIPWPQVMAPFVGVVEIVCGTLLLVGFLTRLASVPLLIDICVALYSTKIVTFAKNGLWSTLHEARTDVSMLLGLIFLLLVGGGEPGADEPARGAVKKPRRLSLFPRAASGSRNGCGAICRRAGRCRLRQRCLSGRGCGGSGVLRHRGRGRSS